MNYALSAADIYRLLNHKTNVILYRDLAYVNKIEDVMRNGSCVILYESKDNSGHWCCIFLRGPKEIQWFDSYGLLPDSELQFIRRNYRRRSNQYFTHLTKLLLDWMRRTGGVVKYSEYRLQKLKKGDNTCGRFVVLRLLLRDLDEDEFAEVVPNSQTAVKLTSPR